MHRFLVVLVLWAATLVAGPATAQQTQTLTGFAENVTVGVEAGVTLQLTRFPNNTFALTGSFDHVTLFGDISATGVPPMSTDGVNMCAEGHECMHFTGTLSLDQRSGFPNGTQTSFVMSLTFDQLENSAFAVFHVGPLDAFRFEQYGTIKFAAPVS